jgi:hypothetical protein
LISDKRFFPALLVLGNLAAAAVCLWARDFRRAAYWIASACCIGLVAFGE